MSSNVTRVRKMQYELDEAEERAGMAETTVSKLLVRTRQQTTKVAMVSPPIVTITFFLQFGLTLLFYNRIID